MLYLITLGFITLWMTILLCRRMLSWHSIVTAYVIGVACVDFFEGLLNVILELYQFSPHLRSHPVYDNELGVVFADFLILPFTFVIYVHYAARSKHPWKISLPFALLFIALEAVYLKLGYMKYVHWSILISSLFYIAGFRFGACLAPRIASYDPPIPYRVRLLCASHMIFMWVSAVFALPLLKLYRLKPGLFHNFMTDCRVAELVSGDIISVLCMIFIPMTPQRRKPLVFGAFALVCALMSVCFHLKGWYEYYHWNLFLSILRYLVPLGVVMLYDRWETQYKAKAVLSAS